MGIVAVASCAALVLPLVAANSPAAASPGRSHVVSWQTHFNAPGAVEFEDLSCPTAQECVAVGGNSVGAIYRSTNAGRSWTRVAVPSSAGVLRWVSCGTANRCVAVGLVLLATHDGGASWAIERSNWDQLVGVEALACGGTACMAITSPPVDFYRSTNDGATWTASPYNPIVAEQDVSGLSCPTSTTCYAVTNNYVLKSVGGLSNVLSVGDLTAYVAGGVPLSSISCVTATTCTVAGLGAAGRTVAWTANSGLSWHMTKLPTGLGPTIDLGCASADVCTLVGLAHPVTGSPLNLVAVVTADRGARWTVRPMSPVAEANWYPGDQLGGIACARGPCVVAGFGTPEDEAFTSAGTGRRWTTRRVGTGLSQLSQVTCTFSSICLAVGGNLIVRSTNDGTSWTRSTFAPPPDVQLEGVTCASADYCVISALLEQPWPHGWTPLTYLSTNAGLSWSADTVATTIPGSISCVSTTVCVGLSAGSLLRTTDAGSTWDPPTSVPPEETLSSVSCDAAGDCLADGTWVGGPSGQDVESDAVTSSDGGTTWTSISPPGAWGELDCVSGAVCYALTNNDGPLEDLYVSAVSVTTDDGQHWTSVSAPSTLVSLECTLSTCAGVAAANTVHGWPGPTSLWTGTAGSSGFTWAQSAVEATVGFGIAQTDDGVAVVLGTNGSGGPMILSDG